MERQRFFEAEIYNADDKLFVIKSLADYFKMIKILEAMQEEVGSEGLVYWGVYEKTDDEEKED